MTQEDYKNERPAEDEKEFDILQMASQLWAKRRKVFTWCFCGAVLGIIIAFSIPKEYTTTAKLAPELPDSKTGGSGLSALASMAGLSTGSNGLTDAVYPLLYPDVVSSLPFTTSLFDVLVTTKDGETMTVKEYMEEKQESPWWSAILGLPGKVIGLFTSNDDEETLGKDHKLNNFELTRQESALVAALSSRITASVDDKTMVETIVVKMQDPRVSAMLADTVVARLQQFITEYRTNKARNDLAYGEKLQKEAKAEYYEAQQRLADYLDKNQGIAFRSAQVTRDRLENEAALAFNLYNQTAQHVQKAQAKVQEMKPICAVLEPATVPIKPSSPRKPMIIIGFTFLAFVACAAMILYITPMKEARKAKKEAESEKEA